MTVTGWVAGCKKRIERKMLATELQFTDLAIEGWQSVLDRHPMIFNGIMPGARVGLMSKDDFEPPSAMMVVWEATDGMMQARYERFPGFDRVNIDLMFIADDETIRRIHDPASPAPFTEIKTKVRRREILLYIVKSRQELLEWGYEDFLESLGLVFMGTCR
jgi:uncharacterized membrane protein (UPF0127 family)